MEPRHNLQPPPPQLVSANHAARDAVQPQSRPASDAIRPVEVAAMRAHTRRPVRARGGRWQYGLLPDDGGALVHPCDARARALETDACAQVDIPDDFSRIKNNKYLEGFVNGSVCSSAHTGRSVKMYDERYEVRVATRAPAWLIV